MSKNKKIVKVSDIGMFEGYALSPLCVSEGACKGLSIGQKVSLAYKVGKKKKLKSATYAGVEHDPCSCGCGGFSYSKFTLK